MYFEQNLSHQFVQAAKRLNIIHNANFGPTLNFSIVFPPMMKHADKTSLLFIYFFCIV